MLDLGTLQAHIKLDGVEGFKRELKSIKSAVDGSSQATESSMTSLERSMATAEKSIEKAAEAINKSTRDAAQDAASNLSDVGSAAEDASSTASSATKTIADSMDEIGKASEDASKTTRSSTSNIEDSLENVQQASRTTSKSVDADADKIINKEKEVSRATLALEAVGVSAAKAVEAAFKAMLAAITAGAAALGAGLYKITKESTMAYATTEQLRGGVLKLFGEETAKVVEKNAQAAFETVGVSANEYMENVTSFSASLISSLGGDTAKAAEIADMAMQDMADNANMFGSDIASIQNAYQGFSKQNYTMLDNLKLGYGGTKTEMERLLKDAQELTGIEYNIDNLADVYSAIHAIQVETKIAGTTANEAAGTIEGSINSTKAAWENLLAGLGDSESDVTVLANRFVGSFENVVHNVAPVLQRIADEAEKIFPVIAAAIEEQLPVLMPSITKLIQSIGKLLPPLMKILAQVIVECAPVFLEAIGELLLSIREYFNENATFGAQNTVAMIMAGLTVYTTHKIKNFFQDIGVITKKEGDNIFKVIARFGDKILNLPIFSNLGAMAAAGLGLAASGLLILGAAYVGTTNDIMRATKASYAWTDEQKEVINRIDRTAESYKQLKEARDNQIQGINAETLHSRELVDEYNSLIDSNGQIKEGYEARADTILNLLAQALGVERSEIQATIDEYGHLSSAIVDVIQKKKAEAVLAAEQEAYTEAIQNRTQAAEDYANAQSNLAQAQQEYADADRGYQEVMATYEDILSRNSVAANQYLADNANIIAAHDAAAQKLVEAQQAVQTAQDTMVGYEQEISRYEGLFEAITSGNADAINAQMARITDSFLTAEEADRASLERQVEDFDAMVNKLQAMVDAGMPGVTQATVNHFKELRDMSIAELEKAPPEANKAGAEATTEFGKGEKSAESEATGAAASVRDAAVSELDKADSYPSGWNLAAGYAKGIKEGTTLVNQAVISMVDDALAKVRDTQVEGSPSKLTTISGRFFAQGFALGIEQEIARVVRNASSMTTQAIQATKASAALPSFTMDNPSSLGEYDIAPSGDVYNIYINGTRINDDAQITEQFVTLMKTMARKGMM